ncbi:pseudouridine synthase domain protein, partial [Yersinia pestis PY-29]
MSGFELDQEETLVQQNTLAQQEKPAEVAGLKI